MNKPIKRIALSMLLFLPLAVANATTIYHVVCRGGSVGNTSLSLDMWQQAPYDMRATLVYHFEPFLGPRSAISTTDRSYLSPGQCSFSTGVLSKSQNVFVHYLGSDPHVNLALDFTPTRANNIQDMNSMYINFNTIPSLMWSKYPYIPANGGGEGTDPALVAGTILDPNMIFDFGMQIINGVFYVDHLNNSGTPLK